MSDENSPLNAPNILPLALQPRSVVVSTARGPAAIICAGPGPVKPSLREGYFEQVTATDSRNARLGTLLRPGRPGESFLTNELIACVPRASRRPSGRLPVVHRPASHAAMPESGKSLESYPYCRRPTMCNCAGKRRPPQANKPHAQGEPAREPSQTEGHRQELRRDRGAEGHRPRDRPGRGASASWATTAPASRRWSRSSPATSPRAPGRSKWRATSSHFHRPIDARQVGIEVVYQDLAIADNLTAADNVFLGRELKKGWGPFETLDKKAMIARSSELFEELKSETRPRDLVRKMSGGQRQAVAIAAHPPLAGAGSC